MNDDTGSSRGRQPRAGDLTGIDLLLTARGGGGSSSTAGATTHQKAPRRRNRFSRFRGLISRPRIVLPVAVIVLAGASAGVWAVTRSTASAAPSYRLVPAAITTMRQALSSTGTIEPATTATLSFGAPGQVTAVDVTVGQRVTKGQILATMDSASLKAQAAQARASLAGAQSQLSQDQASSASSAQLAADQSSVNAAQSQVGTANAALAGTTLTSPVNGIVVSAGLTIGQQVSGGSGGGGGGGGGGGTGGGGEGSGGGSSGGGGSGGGSGGTGSSSSSSSITVISANDVINANVNATVVGQIKTGDQVVITTEGAAGPVQGRVASIGLIANTSSGVATFPVVIDVTGTPSGLYAGASATVSIIYNQLTNVLAVPAAAVGFSGGKTVVYTIVHGHRVAKDVTTGLTSAGLTQITSGLTAGQQVVVEILASVSGGPGGTNNGVFGPGGKVILQVPGSGASAVPVGGVGG